MIEFTTQEAQLFRVLAGFFGTDQVIPQMRVIAVCGGSVPEACRQALSWDVDGWARQHRCLFTIIDSGSQPRMVIEFCEDGSTGVVDVAVLEHTRCLGQVLDACGIRYLTISHREFQELLHPDSDIDLVTFLGDKMGILEEIMPSDPEPEPRPEPRGGFFWGRGRSSR